MGTVGHKQASEDMDSSLIGNCRIRKVTLSVCIKQLTYSRPNHYSLKDCLQSLALTW